MNRAHRRCYCCGYLLDPAQDRARCPECGSDDQPAARATARYYLMRPGRLFLRACVIGRSIPPALWRSGADARLADARLLAKLRRYRIYRFIFWLVVAIVLLLLIGPSRVVQVSYSNSRVWPDGRIRGSNSHEQVGPWLDFITYDPCGESPSLSRSNLDEAPYSLYCYLDPSSPRYQCWSPIPRFGWVDYRPWPSYRIIREWDLEPIGQWIYLRRISQIVFVPIFNWLCCLLLLHLLTWAAARGDSGTAFDAMDRRAALTAVGQAAFVPIRVAWIGVILLVIPLLAEPGLTQRFRVIAYWTLLAIGAAGPCLVTLRCLFADRSFCLRWGRIVPGFVLFAFGYLMPGWLVRWGIYWGTFQLLLVGEHFMDLKAATLQ